MAVKCILTGQTPSVLDGVTENVQTQLNDKVDKITGKGLSTNDYTSTEKTKLSGIEEGAQKNTITGVKGSAETTYRTGNVNITATNIGLGNVNNTSDAEKPISTATQTALNGKQATITGAATTITDNNLTANRALISNSNGKVEVSSVTSTELSYLDGVTSNIQTQLNNKLSSAPVTSVNNKTGAVTLAKGDVGLGNVDNTSDANKPISNATQAVLNGKQAKITTSGILKGDGAGNVSGATPGTDYVASPEIFWATYNVTTFPEIKAAYDAGKVILLKIPVNVVETTTTEASQVAPLENYFYENSEQHGEYGSAQFSLQGLSNVRGYPYQKLSDNYLYMVSYSNNTTNWENNYSISAPVSTSCEKILLAADWDAAAKTQTLSNMELIDAFTNGSLRIAQSATDEQFTAWGAAQPRVTAQAYGSITVKIAGTVPTIDIPVEVLIV